MSIENIRTVTSYTDITSDPELSPNEKHIMNLVRSFNESSQGLFLSNTDIGKLYNLGPKTVGNLLNGLARKKRIVIENAQSKYRKILLPSDSGSRTNVLPLNDGSSKNLLPSDNGSTSIIPGPTSIKQGTYFHQPMEHNEKTKLTEKTKDSFSLDKEDINNGEFKSASKQFREAYELYQGTKRNLNTEFFEFKNIQDWAKVLPLLKPAIEKQNRARELLKAQDKFSPEPKHFKNWLRDRDWELVIPELEAQSKADAERKRIDRKRQEYLKTYSGWVREADPEDILARASHDVTLMWVVKQVRPELLQRKDAS